MNRYKKLYEQTEFIYAVRGYFNCMHNNLILIQSFDWQAQAPDLRNFQARMGWKIHT